MVGYLIADLAIKENIVYVANNDIELFEINDFINEVVYDQPLVTLLDENIRKITYLLLITTGLFILIALLLINSSIRLSIYSKSFIIKTIQLV